MYFLFLFQPILYSYFRSSASWRVRIVLALKGVDYEYKAVNLVKDGGQQHSEEFKALNPMEQVPAFVIGETALTQSLAIIDYLEDVYPKPAIVPEDPIKKAQARALAELIAAGTQPIQNLGVLQKVSDKPEERAEWGQFWIDKGFAAYEKMVQSTAGKYSVGDEITIADVCLVPQLYNAQRFKVDMTKFPTITRIIDALSELPAFKAADPGVQPDCPEELRKQ
ncbi:maleylacetoacetate isomerase-like isoform X2 [Ruditapes philippinarum]|uniref:maleylacetoacetate isomerase-like isoform X2 n=1 Tax=Ruditapes philippinarum TaxID=129788 RepID=UPI00295AD3BD|nr:maleylacetoacetate isomerase-like isoform X2 [Ruditapes philippinarum]